ncbi:hypothetical protein KIPB_003942 [Kipferlia bialata]|uniref:Uncharacterized protein n=1 Tax=Kipferlia bialata TaxID=797122 RepID=A0A9K3CT01_9EUKA|nr:hypothetical protein KIPB_003942 [Kipferlia bialata]|eukprot:g3942.t1
MGTPGLFGFRVNGQDKITHAYGDGYPSGLGVQMMDFIQACGSVDVMRTLAESITLTDGQDPDLFSAPCGDLQWLCNKGKMVDNSSYMTNNIIHSAYIIDLDECMFTVYSQVGNRTAHMYLGTYRVRGLPVTYMQPLTRILSMTPEEAHEVMERLGTITNQIEVLTLSHYDLTCGEGSGMTQMFNDSMAGDG